jgi:hypothetical protein
LTTGEACEKQCHETRVAGKRGSAALTSDGETAEQDNETVSGDDERAEPLPEELENTQSRPKIISRFYLSALSFCKAASTPFAICFRGFQPGLQLLVSFHLVSTSGDAFKDTLFLTHPSIILQTDTANINL